MTENPEAKYLRDLAERFESPVDSNTLRACATRIDLLTRSLDEERRAYLGASNHRDNLAEQLAEKSRALSEEQTKRERAEHDLACMRENMLEMQRDFREELRDAVAEARREERTGEPYGTY